MLTTLRRLRPVRRVVTLLTPKGEPEATLRWRLQGFYATPLTNGALALERLATYRHTPDLVCNHLRSLRTSGIRSYGIGVVFYARYFTSHQLILERYASSRGDGDLRAKLECKPASRLFAEAVVVELAVCERLPEDDVARRDSYEKIIHRYMGDDELARAFLETEVFIFERIIAEPNSNIRDRFNSITSAAIARNRDAFTDDVLFLAPSRERIRASLERNRLWLAFPIAFGIYYLVHSL